MTLICPTCRAKNADARQCRRCGTDFTLIMKARTDAERLIYLAASSCRDHDYENMMQLAENAVRLWRTPAALHMTACAALLNHKYDAALSLWQQVSNNCPRKAV